MGGGPPGSGMLASSVAAWRVALALAAVAVFVTGAWLGRRSAPTAARTIAGQLLMALALVSLGGVFLPSSGALVPVGMGAAITVAALRSLASRRLRPIYRSGGAAARARPERDLPDGAPLPPPLVPHVVRLDPPPAVAASEVVPKRKADGLELVWLLAGVVRQARAALRRHRPLPLLFLWVFDGEPNGELLEAVRKVGPVHFLRGGAQLGSLDGLATQLLRPARAVATTEAAVLAAVARFRPTRFGILYRLNTLVCNGDVWPFAVGTLRERCRGVVMDLSKYSASRGGCTYELGLLVDTVPLGAVTLVVDEDDDVARVVDALAPLWATMAVDSPNRAEGARPTLVVAPKGTAPQVAALVAASVGGSLLPAPTDPTFGAPAVS